jgi:hypothetical protein
MWAKLGDVEGGVNASNLGRVSKDVLPVLVRFIIILEDSGIVSVNTTGN